MMHITFNPIMAFKIVVYWYQRLELIKDQLSDCQWSFKRIWRYLLSQIHLCQCTIQGSAHTQLRTGRHFIKNLSAAVLEIFLMAIKIILHKSLWMWVHGISKCDQVSEQRGVKTINPFVDVVLQPWRWYQYSSPKRWYLLTSPDVVKTQKVCGSECNDIRKALFPPPDGRWR